jgi:hypothetical protein
MTRIAPALLTMLIPAATFLVGSLPELAKAQSTPAAAMIIAPVSTDSAVQSTDNLIVYRARAEPTAFTPAIEVDGVKIVGLPNRHFTSARIAPGLHTLTIAWPRLSRQQSQQMQFEIMGGERHYFEVTGTSRVVGLGYHSVFIREVSGLAEVAPEQAEQAIAACCKYKPLAPDSKAP